MSGLETMLRTVKDLDFEGKRVLMRVDFNVPIDDNGNILDDNRIRAALPTIQYVFDHGASQVGLMSHLDPWKDNPASRQDERLMMNKVAERTSKLLGQDVTKLDNCVDIVIPSDRIVVLENLRFHAGEKKNDKVFAKKLAEHWEVYVNDAFGTLHREHASVDAVTHYFDEPCAGLLIEKELQYLDPVLKNPKKPLYVVLGGAKVGGKIDVIHSLSKKAEGIYIGGAMALAFAGVKMEPFVGEKEIEQAKELLSQYQKKIFLPIDYTTDNRKNISAKEFREGIVAYDIGSETVPRWAKQMACAGTIIWNGSLGLTETKPFDNGTNAFIEFLSKATKNDVITIVCGGNSAADIRRVGMEDKVSHVSTGGGASLEYLEGKDLPGLKPLYV